MGNACSRRKNRGSLTELGIGEEYDWEGLDETKIAVYEEYKEKVLDGVREQLADDDPDDESFLLGKVSQEERETLKGLLLRRAIALVHVLIPIEEHRSGQRWLHQNGAMPPAQWASYQQAEASCTHELNTLKAESMLVAPGVPPSVIIQTAVRLYHQHGKDLEKDAQEEEGGVQVHPDAKELPTLQLRIIMPREKGEGLGLQVMQLPPAEQRQPGQQSRLVVTGFVQDGFAMRHNEKQDHPGSKLMEGDAIVGIADGSLPPEQAKPVVNDAEAILEFMAKDSCAVTPLALLVVRILGPALRFRMGARVKARCGEEGWLPGQVIRCWEADSNGEKKPYVIRLDNGRVVLAPRDHEDVVVAGEPAKEGQVAAGGAAARPSKADNWAKGMFGKQKPGGDKDKAEEEPETQGTGSGFQVHPDAKDVPVVKVQAVLKRDSGEALGIALHHEPPLEQRKPGQPSCLFVSDVLPGGFAIKHNQSMENPAQRIQRGDRIMAVLDGSAPEDKRKPVGDDSEAMLEVITRDKNAVTPLVFFIVRALGPPLRFTEGQRVKANCGPDGWLNGKVVKLWETGSDGSKIPYVIKIDGQDRAVTASADSEDSVVKADPRFKVDDVVMVNTGQCYKACLVLEVGKQKGKQKSKGAYKVEETAGSPEFWVPSDVDQVVRAFARFQKGDRVKANVGGQFVPGVVEEVYHPAWVYAIRLDKDGNLVTSPGDTDQFVVKADPRFKVDDVVMVNTGKSYKECKVLEVGNEKSKGAYRVKETAGSAAFWVPRDVDQAVRAPARFKKGDRIKANVGQEFVPGVVEEVYHPAWVYAMRLDKDGSLVTSPGDTDQYVKKGD